MEYEPPLPQIFKNLSATQMENKSDTEIHVVSEPTSKHQLPVVDLGRLNQGEINRKECEKQIIEAAKEWGFFQVVNHGISEEILVELQKEQVKLFRQPFYRKANQNPLKSPKGSYRLGNPAATSLAQFSWSEAFHVPVSSVSEFRDINNLSCTVEEYTEVVSELSGRIAEILAEDLGISKSGYRKYFSENIVPNSCYIRMNRYPPCPKLYSKAYGLVSHTDSSYLTILHQDKIGGLQLQKNGAWISVKPNHRALVINIGDLFQAWSNGLYTSVKHRVVTNSKVERLSVAYLFCPTADTLITSCTQPSIYRDFTFQEFKTQVQQDVISTGNKIGLPKFLRS